MESDNESFNLEDLPMFLPLPPSFPTPSPSVRSRPLFSSLFPRPESLFVRLRFLIFWRNTVLLMWVALL